MTLCTCVMAWGQNNVRLEYEGYQQDFTTLQAAFNALPPNSTPATVTLLNDVSMNFEAANYVTVPLYSNVTIELAGYVVTASMTKPGHTCTIFNKGTLTIQDSSEGQTGKITSNAVHPDQSEGFPGYGGYTIINKGTLYLNSGTLENNTPNAACNYVVENNPAWSTSEVNGNKNVKFIMNGGKVLQESWDDAIRIWTNAPGSSAEMIVNGGEIISRAGCLFIHGDGAVAPVDVTINGGTWKSIGTYEQSGNGTYMPGDYRIIDCLCFQNDKPMNNINITVNDGDFYGMVYTRSYNNTTPSGFEHIAINGGRWHGLIIGESGEQSTFNPVFVTRYDTRENFNAYGKMINGGTIFAPSGEEVPETWYDDWYNHNTDHKTWVNYITQGYCANDNHDNTWTIAPCETETVTATTTMADIATAITTADPTQQVEATIIEIDATAQSNDAVVTVTEDITVEGIVLKADENDNTKPEGQIVVNSGVTLTIGNSGIVSENNDLTTVVVKPGGTVIVGNGGVTKDGLATPVEIQSTGTESGVFMVDPNAPTALAEAPAKVKVYTRAHKDGGIEYWQQFASPVKGDMTITPLGVGQEEGVYTSVYEWNYSNDAWERVEGMPVDLGGGVTAFGKAGWSENNILTPFKAYNLINNSHLSEGGITYEFAGELVGNNDMTLTFPANGFCVFGNSYTAPIDLTTLFDQIENDMSLENIDACVYIYNSAKDRFESVNALTLEMATAGFDEAPFTQIPPQQAFVMNLLDGGSAQTAVDYAKSVWGNPQTNKNTPIMAPKRANSTISAVLNINVTDGVSSDRVVLVEDNKYSESYDNGADAEKYMNSSFNIYANAERNLAMLASDNIEGTELTFAAGNAVNYTMTFGKTMGEFVLVDRANNSQVAIEEGGIYTFAAQPNYTAEARFAIVPAAKMPTAIENTEVKSNVKGIYTITGQYMGEDFNVLPAGVYVIDGVKIVK